MYVVINVIICVQMDEDTKQAVRWTLMLTFKTSITDAYFEIIDEGYVQMFFLFFHFHILEFSPRLIFPYKIFASIE
jgi:hypothetical protein